VLALVHSLRKNRRLLRDLVTRDLRARYVGSSMGFFWSVVVPILSLFIYMFVFRLVLKMRWSDQQGTTEVALLMLAGILVWHAFAESLSRMTNALVENQNLIQKVVFPSEVLPVYLTISSLVNMLIGLVVALAGVVFFAYVRPAEETRGPIVALWSEHAAEHPARGNGVVRALDFRCAAVGTTRADAESVEDTATPPWKHATARLGAGELSRFAPGDLVYAAQRWAVLKRRDGARFTHDGWKDARGAPAEPPPAGSELVVVAPPSRPLALSGWLVLLAPLVALQGLFMLGLGYLFAAFNLFLRDTYHVMGVALTVWMFATPIFYPAHLVSDAGYGWLVAANPMAWLIDAYREVLIYGAGPDWGTLGLFALVALLLVAAGSSFFLKHKPRFPDLL